MSHAQRSGVLSVEKWRGVTSFQVVAHLRRLLRAPKVGHGGTLDPDATGVLPILIGEATKLTPYLVELDKEYLATVTLGLVTDTQDAAGTVLETRAVPPLTEAQLRQALEGFVGEIAQVPPMYSALHHGGRRLHEIARAGGEVERRPRRVRVHAITLESLALPHFTMRVHCGKGTYVRTLAADVGEALGCGGALSALVRTRVGPYDLAAAVPCTEVREARDGTRLWERLLPVDSPIQGFPAITLAAAVVPAFLHGQAVPVPGAAEGLLRAFSPDGAFLGLGLGRGGDVKPERLLHADRPRPGVLPG
ncbi:MAG: tRNA pseudouridine(55) synthase TruB [Candidatus Rokubacteria bacterium]|nr:tRNA pseudouridine(55) synthase TruB [Candidatus Rokubacteria bacterium]